MTVGTSSRARVGWAVTISLDGFVADPNDTPGRLFDLTRPVVKEKRESRCER